MLTSRSSWCDRTLNTEPCGSVCSKNHGSNRGAARSEHLEPPGRAGRAVAADIAHIDHRPFPAIGHRSLVEMEDGQDRSLCVPPSAGHRRGYCWFGFTTLLPVSQV